ncbi:MAG: hypothetical protein IAC06_05510 [Bacteroidetes bacterium]|jgi:hypothetical protein|uniref:Uncharacterized protein n=1 Tax=Candidatus Cryptobacteroides intestinavium TaxID=2840766 RepID=A0A9D9ERI9_9BACT|nr:hypothetical protein [Candidatus Cryptobacteroides intestinavium]
MKKNLIIAAGAVLMAAAVSAFVYVNNKESNSTSLLKANAEALAAEETGGLDANYKRKEEKCTITAGAGAKIKIFGGNITVGSRGTVTFDGKVICKSGGDETCRPIECIDLYEIL